MLKVLMFRTDLKRAIQEILMGHAVGLPTETVYGLAARIDQPDAIKSIFQLKQRPFFDPLIVHVNSIEQAKTLVSWWPPEAQTLAEQSWPGPLTLVLPKASHIDPMITSGLDSIAVRWPKHKDFQAVLDAVNVPLAAPSANKFGRTSPTTAEHVRKEFINDSVFVLDGGPCDVGIESTVVKISKAKKNQISILRKGHYSESELKDVLANHSVEFTNEVSTIESPGQMKHHYMPQVPLVIINSGKQITDLSSLIFKKVSQLPDEIEHIKINKLMRPPQNIAELKLSTDPRIAARQFYSELRRLSESGSECIVYFKSGSQLENNELWEALNDRMNKAASLVLND